MYGDALRGASTVGGLSQEIEALADRFLRLERIVSLFLVPVIRSQVFIEWGALQRYLDEQSDASLGKLKESYPTWRRDITCVYIHNATGIRADFSGYQPVEQARLLEALLTVAACEGRMPMALLQEIQPGCLNAVDALASEVAEPGE